MVCGFPGRGVGGVGKRGRREVEPLSLAGLGVWGGGEVAAVGKRGRGGAGPAQQRAPRTRRARSGFPPAPYPSGFVFLSCGLVGDAVGVRVLLAKLGSCGYCHHP